MEAGMTPFNPGSGALRPDELAPLVQRGEIDTVLTVFPDLYGRLLGKRVTGRFFLKQVESGGMHACDYLLASDMEMDPIPGYQFASWESGYGDMQCLPDATTLRRAAWLERTALVLCDLRTEPGGRPIEVSPRRMLQRQVQRAREAGFRVMGGSEIEFYLFDESYQSARSKHYHDLSTAAAYIEDYHILQGTREDATVGAIRRALDASGVPVESTKGEWGPGQQELNLEYCEALQQADRNVIYSTPPKRSPTSTARRSRSCPSGTKSSRAPACTFTSASGTPPAVRARLPVISRSARSMPARPISGSWAGLSPTRAS
jgi:glutamine synthetase